MIKKTVCITTGIIAALAANAGDLSRADIDAKLKELADKPSPTKLAPGATCYEVAMPPNRIEYVCPTCGTKTILKNDTGWLLPNLESYRKQTEELRKLSLDIKIDESALCSKCRQGESGTNILYWKIKIDGKERKVDFKEQDIDILREFLRGNNKINRKPGGKQPLKNYLPRLNELIGPVEKATKTEAEAGAK